MANIDAAREEFVAGYHEAMLWSNAYLADSEGEFIDGRDYAEPSDVDRSDADTFWDSLGYVIMAIPYYIERGADYAGHDFALTRNGHGAGFWDRGLGRLGDMLTEECRPYGSHSVIIEVDANDDVISTCNTN